MKYCIYIVLMIFIVTFKVLYIYTHYFVIEMFDLFKRTYLEKFDNLKFILVWFFVIDSKSQLWRHITLIRQSLRHMKETLAQNVSA